MLSQYSESLVMWDVQILRPQRCLQKQRRPTPVQRLLSVV